MDFVYDGKDRRRHKRVRVNFISSYEIREPISLRVSIPESEIYTCMYDLSEGGLSIATQYDITLSSVLVFKFVLINLLAFRPINRSLSLTLVGQVVYNNMLEKNERRVGVYFKDINDKERKSISDFVERESIHSSIS